MNVGGGGGGFAAGCVIGKNSEGSAAAGGLVLAVGIIAGTAYGISYVIDAPKREPIVHEIVEESLAECANAELQPALYTTDLKDELTSIWSETLDEIRSHENFIICMEPNLNTFTLPYDFMTFGETEEPEARHFGEYRVTGVFYQNNDGTDVLVIKPDSDLIPETSKDLAPDKPHSLKKIYAQIAEIPEQRAPRASFALDSHGYTKYDISVLLQQDGAKQRAGSSSLSNEDNAFWADEALLERVQSHYEFGEPL